MERLGLLELPDECIYLVLSFLRPSQVRRLALTFNRRLLTIAKPFLEPLSKIRRDEAYFEALFPAVPPEHHTDDKFLGRYLDIIEVSISVPSKPSHHLEYLDLNDDLVWLERIAEEDNGEIDGEACEIYPEEDHEKLIKSAAHLGLTLPASFIKLLRSDSLLAKLSTVSTWYIELGGLHKIRKLLAHDATRYEDGYIFTWFSDQQGCYYTHMYLDTAGRHAILGSGSTVMSREEDEGVKEEWLDITDAEDREGVLPISSNLVEDLELEDVDFERWLVNQYYKGWCQSLANIKEASEMSEHFRRHLYKVYSEEGRAMQ